MCELALSASFEHVEYICYVSIYGYYNCLIILAEKGVARGLTRDYALVLV